MGNKCEGCKHLKMDYIANSPCDTCNRKVLKDNFEPAEPVVLSASLMRVKMAICPDIFEGVKQIDDYGEAMHQNGRLERDLELREVMKKAVRKFGIVPVEEIALWVGENIKPLNKD